MRGAIFARQTSDPQYPELFQGVDRFATEGWRTFVYLEKLSAKASMTKTLSGTQCPRGFFYTASFKKCYFCRKCMTGSFFFILFSPKLKQMKTKAKLLLALFIFAMFAFQGCRSQDLCPAYSDAEEAITEDQSVSHT